jgi:TonB family protein
MKRSTVLLILIISSFLSARGQQVIKYYKDEYLTKPVGENGRYQEILTNNKDGSITRELIDKKKGKLLYKYRNDEPIGKWSNGMDFDFDLNIDDSKCDNRIIEDDKGYFNNHPEVGYIAPKISGSKTFVDHLVKKLRYPQLAIENNMQGRLNLKVLIDESGKVTSVSLVNSVYPPLDKEAGRIIRELRLDTPAFLNGKPNAICFVVPISFRFE